MTSILTSKYFWIGIGVLILLMLLSVGKNIIIGAAILLLVMAVLKFTKSI